MHVSRSFCVEHVAKPQSFALHWAILRCCAPSLHDDGEVRWLARVPAAMYAMLLTVSGADTPCRACRIWLPSMGKDTSNAAAIKTNTTTCRQGPKPEHRALLVSWELASGYAKYGGCGAGLPPGAPGL